MFFDELFFFETFSRSWSSPSPLLHAVYPDRSATSAVEHKHHARANPCNSGAVWCIAPASRQAFCPAQHAVSCSCKAWILLLLCELCPLSGLGECRTREKAAQLLAAAWGRPEPRANQRGNQDIFCCRLLIGWPSILKD